MTPVKVKEETTKSELKDLWVDYVGYINQAPEEERPIWVAYDPNIFRGTIHLVAVVPNDNDEAQFNLFRAEAKINREQSYRTSYYLDTLVYDEEDQNY